MFREVIAQIVVSCVLTYLQFRRLVPKFRRNCCFDLQDSRNWYQVDSEVVRVSYLFDTYCLQENRKYVVSEAFSGIPFIPSLVKIDQRVQKLTWKGRTNSMTLYVFCFFRRLKWSNNMKHAIFFTLYSPCIFL